MKDKKLKAESNFNKAYSESKIKWAEDQKTFFATQLEKKLTEVDELKIKIYHLQGYLLAMKELSENTKEEGK